MKITVNDDDGNIIGYAEIDDISEIPEESRDKVISTIIATTKEYHLAKLAHDEELKKAELRHEEWKKEITTKVEDIVNSLRLLAEIVSPGLNPNNEDLKDKK